ncbi:LysR family transcriptional regulator [Bradyrhizobium sp. U87765 SZCCT0131]|uniref:LysR substrate-binding domain-containing protein n=1 Tax=unclassified Bradyrhizobium TaxID=2631580 RepID=UPI001BA92BB6|nr:MULTISPECIES: LysR substrate-binding domain-containing protein [unclassified Bradyrhizobium]MBR1219889.1 LysR family transcriptional regulator [Bradyrhizobium sp. U87765 SZCCT0131]MBR1260479.1 LysR family transcriptional regulator [Bradyrhizobium sp. U87765 SZCCT0134]MBR1309224.1 LysR family transcriptional regulator [Bradyrhizobium sp. U87765 SZCCT0110]MBR1323987.1 LysR family transcriptional regulator [Bradyrhizobium sp. U87765 SZCCT0109]MBR1349539.1 LysR family transcriptional regulator 
MARPAFDLEVLRSFVTGMELGSFAKAADRLGRSTSAVSAQIRKLEDQAGTAIFRKAGRGLALTEAGETMLSYARRLLDLNDEAAIAVQGLAAEGIIRIGMQEDFGEVLLPKVLGRFARAHPKVRIEARVGRKGELMERIGMGRLDLAVAWDDGAAPAAAYRSDIATVPVGWIGPADGAMSNQREAEPLPLISYDDGCWFRSIGTAALDRINQPWRVALTSASLSGIWAGVSAGLGLTVRTPLGLAAGVCFLDASAHGLPELPSIRLALYRCEAELDPVAERLAAILTEEARFVL